MCIYFSCYTCNIHNFCVCIFSTATKPKEIEECLQHYSHHLDMLNYTMDNKDSVNTHQIVDHIKILSEMRSKLIKKRCPPQAWPIHFLQHPVIEKFVIWAIKKVHTWTSREGNQNCNESINLLKIIISPVDLDILESSNSNFVHKICSLYHTDTLHSIINLTNHHIIELFSITGDLCKELIEDNLAGIACNDCSTFKCMLQYFEVYRNHMNKTKTCKMLLLETLMLTLNYNVETNNYGIVCNEELQYFNTYKKKVEEYFESTEENSEKIEKNLKFQAFLFDLTADIGVSCCGTTCILKESILNHIKYLKQQLSSDLFPQIIDILNAFGNILDFENIRQYLSIVARGNEWNNEQSLHVAISTHLNKDNVKALQYSDKGEADSLLRNNNNNNLQAMLNTLKLTEKYPQKITLKDALIIKPEVVMSNNDLSELPYVTLRKIMTCDHKSRSYLCPIKENNITTQGLTTVHPVDVIISLLHCSDNFLRQALLSKLTLCQMAIPLLLPDTIKNTVTLLLWALRSVEKICEPNCTNGEHSLKQCSIVEYEGPIISFVRYGELNHSKSEILNKVIGHDDIFFHWNLEATQESKKCTINGVLDICYYSPSSDEAQFSNSIIFTNLHGNAVEHLIQTTFVKKISFITVILLSEKFVRETNENTIKTVLQDFALVPGGSIILTDTQELYKNLIENFSNDLTVICIENKQLAIIKSKIITSIKKKLEIKHTFKSIASYVEEARKLKINIDEEDEDCASGKYRASVVMKHVRDNMSDSKYNILPMQGPHYWHKWVACNNERYQHKEKPLKTSANEYIQQKEEEKVALRSGQLSCKYSSFTHEFIINILISKGNERKYFLHWLKMYINQHLGFKLPKLQQQYKQLYLQIKQNSAVESADSKKQKDLRDKSEKLRRMQHDISFGLEHCFRELGQLFEAIEEAKHLTVQGIKNSIYLLPQLAVEALIAGFPLEIMDGEASHIPVTWIQAVITCLEKKYDDKKIFVLSILGVQSSGKSTLLNTMFGLHFKVSAGRCTQGAFIQLLEIDESLKNELKCDLILIVDSEGIRAPELLNKNFEEHDNKLATFVIGLADLTIINIFGEASADISDILQTVVHALIRMKQVEKHSSCIFVHQNVTGKNIDKTLEGMQMHTLLTKLDNTTKMIAKEEECEEKYTKFQDVISFNEDTDIHNFNGLWKGNPPMAPINPGYSENASNLKKALLTVISKYKCSCTFSGFKYRIINVWEAILKENYLFRFRNVTEICAYRELDEQLGKWNLQLQEATENKLHECENKIANSKLEDIADVKNECMINSCKQLEEMWNKLTEELYTFIKDHKDSNVLSKWSYFAELKLGSTKSHYCDMINNYCKSKGCERQKNEDKEKLLLQCEEKIDKEITEVAEKHINLIPQEIESLFNSSWKMWMDDCRKLDNDVDYVTDDMISTTIEHAFISKFEKERDILAEATKFLVSSTGDDTFKSDPNKHINPIKAILTLDACHQEVVCKLKQLSQEHIAKATAIIHEKLEALKTYTFTIIDHVLILLTNTIDEFNKNPSNNQFTFTSKYKYDIALYICKMAKKEIKEWLKHKKDQGLVATLENQKSRFFVKFQNKCNRVNIEKAAAIQICQSLIEVIPIAVCNTIKLKIVRDLKRCSKSFESKMHFIAQVLTDLANESFPSYCEYFEDCNESLKKWAERYIIMHAKSKSRNSSETVFIQLVNNEIDLLATDIRKATVSKPVNCSNQEWIDEFCFILEGKLEIKKAYWTNDVNTIENLENLKRFLIQELNKELKSKTILNNIEKNMDHICKDAGKMLYDSLIGSTCVAQCPFCQELCNLNNSTHIKQNIPHYVKIHRPQCIVKSVDCLWQKDDTSMLNNCNFLVSSDLNFEFSKLPMPNIKHKSKAKILPLTEYQAIYKEWEISGEAIGPPEIISTKTGPSDYWKWVVSHFRSDILSWTNLSELDIPEAWEKISKEEAIKSLEEMYVFSCTSSFYCLST